MSCLKKIACLMVLFVLFLPLISAETIEIKDFVNDYAGIIDENTEHQIESVLQYIYDSGIAQYSIVTVNSLDGKDIESYSLALAQGNLGDTEKNNGLLLLVAVEDREYRFEVGRGIEYILNDAKVGRIGRYYLVENFRNGDYGKGILEASYAVKSVLLGDNESEYYVDEYEGASYDDIYAVVFMVFVFMFAFGLPILAIILRKRKFKNKYFNAASGAIILFGGRGGHHGGGFGGGGFGGFGGGGFGGGGAGGSF